jgi:hypothetical protein
MDLKAAGEGYKIYSLYNPHDFMFNFKFSTVNTKIAELPPYPPYSNGETTVLRLAEYFIKTFPPAIPCTSSTAYYVPCINNIFTRMRLYEELRRKGIGANSTCMAGSEVSKELASFRDCTTKEKNFRL